VPNRFNALNSIVQKAVLLPEKSSIIILLYSESSFDDLLINALNKRAF